jgi:hypothetical protein
MCRGGAFKVQRWSRGPEVAEVLHIRYRGGPWSSGRCSADQPCAGTGTGAEVQRWSRGSVD